METQYLTQQNIHGVVVLTLNEPLLNADAVKECVSIIDASESRKVILDFQVVRWVLSGNLFPDRHPFTSFLNLNKQLKEKGGRLILCNVASDLADVLRVTRFDRILKVRPNIESAVASMKEPTESTTYSHTQKAPLCVLIYAVAAVFLALGWFIQDAPPIPWLFPPIGVLLLVVAASFHHLSVVDLGEVLAIRFGPVPLFRRTVRYSDIASVEVGRTTSLEGWGIHMSIRGGWVWNLWGWDCVVVRFKNGGTLRIGTNDAANLSTFLQSRLVMG